MNQVIVSHEIPSIYENLKAKFDANWDDGVIIAYGGKVHCKFQPDPQKIIHEAVHLERQKSIGEDAWWRLYIENSQFRRDEEILAYVAEANFLKRYIKNREHRFQMIHSLALTMSSQMYGNMISQSEALKILM